MDLALNNLQRLICHKTHQTKTQRDAAVEIRTTFFFGPLQMDMPLLADQLEYIHKVLRRPFF